MTEETVTEEVQMPEYLTVPELLALVNAKSKAKESLMQAQIDELSTNNLLLMLRGKYTLGEQDSVDTSTGLIKRV